MRKLVWLTIGFAAASFAGAALYGDWVLFAAVIGLLLTGTLAVLVANYNKGSRILLILLGCALGFGWFYLYDNLFVLIPRAMDGQVLPVQIEASDITYENDYSSNFEGTVAVNGKTYRVKAYLQEKAEIAPGDLVSGTFRFRVTTDGGRDNATYHRTEGIFLLAYAVGAVSVEKAEEVSYEHYPAIWRQRILHRIQEIFPERIDAFASALLLGDRSGIDYELDTAFQVSGISHIIAVSGMHISILFGLIYTLTARKRGLACLMGIPILFLFAALVGFTPSVTRACVMQSLMLIAMLTDREYDPPTALAFAALVMLVANPLTVLSVSFQLSVGCMVGIFLFSERIRQWLQCFPRFRPGKGLWSRIKQGIITSISITMGATAVTTPLVAYHFGCVSLVGMLTNLVTVWVISYIFYGIILCLAVSTISVAVAGSMSWLLYLPIQFVLRTAISLSKLPMAAVYTRDPYVVAWLVGCYVLIGIFLCQKKKQPLLLALCMISTLLFSQVLSWIEPLQDNCRVTVLDVGQGQSVLLQSDGKSFLVDCGGDYSEDAADAAAETLLGQGISRLDGIVVTHYDADHAGGVPYLLSRIQVDMLILPDLDDPAAQELALYTDRIVQHVSEDMLISYGSTNLTIFAPESRDSDNENSLCILFQREDCDILITGDRSHVGEQALLRDHTIGDVNLLIAGHHGAATSTGEQLLASAKPERVAISVGAGNRYGHPSEDVLKRLQAFGCEIYRTDLHGTIIYRR